MDATSQYTPVPSEWPVGMCICYRVIPMTNMIIPLR